MPEGLPSDRKKFANGFLRQKDRENREKNNVVFFRGALVILPSRQRQRARFAIWSRRSSRVEKSETNKKPGLVFQDFKERKMREEISIKASGCRPQGKQPMSPTRLMVRSAVGGLSCYDRSSAIVSGINVDTHRAQPLHVPYGHQRS